LNNIETTKKLREHNSDDRLLEFFNIKLDGPLNFGKHHVFVESAAECDAEIKAKLRTCGKEIQHWSKPGGRTQPPQLVLNYKNAARTSQPSVNKNGCDSARHNILDQHFAVKCLRFEDDDASGDDEQGRNELSTPRTDDAPFKMWRASAWLYQAAIHDSKKDIDKEIRRRRAQKLAAAGLAGAPGRPGRGAPKSGAPGGGAGRCKKNGGAPCETKTTMTYIIEQYRTKVIRVKGLKNLPLF
jgi:hypothetical protein